MKNKGELWFVWSFLGDFLLLWGVFSSFETYITLFLDFFGIVNYLFSS